MPVKFNELLLKPDIIELYNEGITPNYGYLMNGRFEKDMIKTIYPLKTLSGNPIMWEASDTEYLFPVVSLEPKQAGTGDPSPENIRPISGWDKVQVTRCGKNLARIQPIITDTQIQSVLDFGKDLHFDKLLISFQCKNLKVTYVGATVFRLVKCDGTEQNYNWQNIYINEKRVTTTDNPDGLATLEINNIDFCKLIVVWTRNSYSRISEDSELTKFMVELDPAPTAYEPYQGDTYDMALPETVYGGTVDAVTGAGSKTWGYIASYNGESLPGEWISDRDVYATGTTPTTGAQVAYKLATPEPFQATGNQQLTSLLGYNTIYTDGDSMVLNRKARRLEV